MALILATKADVELVNGFAQDLLANSQYKTMYNKYVFTEDFFNSSQPQLCFIITSEDKPIGTTIFRASVCPDTNVSYARILLLYIKPEYRKQNFMSEVFDMFEFWGREVGCEYYNLGVSNDADLAKRGYVKYEVMYMKEVK